MPPPLDSKATLLLCTLCCPWPNRLEQCRYNLDWAKALTSVGVSTAIFGPAPEPPWPIHRLRRFSSHRARPQRYELEDVQFHSPRVRFFFPRELRQSRWAWLSPSVSKWMQLTVGRSLDAVIEQLEPEALVFHGAFPWARIGINAGKTHDLPVHFIEHSRADLRVAQGHPGFARHYQMVQETGATWLTVSKAMGDALQKVVPEAQSVVVENGAKWQDSPPMRPAHLHGRTIVFTAAHYYRRKGIEELIEAFSELSKDQPEALLVVASDVPTEVEAKLAALGDQALHTGLLPHTEILNWMAWSDLFVLPSRDEAFGIVFAEALLAGTPVVLARDCGIAESLRLQRNQPASQDHDGWALPDSSPESIHEAVQAALQSGEALAAMGAAAAERARRRFDWKASAERMARSIQLSDHLDAS